MSLNTSISYDISILDDVSLENNESNNQVVYTSS